MINIINCCKSTVHLDTQLGWNLISLPVIPSDKNPSKLFPDNVIYSYENGAYIIPNELEIGKGYWIKSTTNGYDITGNAIGPYTITLNKGWHLVGGLEQSVETSFDSDCVEAVFAYQNFSYSIVSEFLTGKGYWVKLKKSCKLKIGVNQGN
ncbi:MAG: hypothetical protein OMM_11745 [Candidatus Magnetoglobus multicellularis str. Araruama]|uniref:Uncharacterized protein n=1 Tax=Candidatus Magnetoglobus multicellularis str. Araruama TaxID=890399 RepID=A0A1V1NXN9_9BACT|nr:MAG: hypothetical protein OMM_11745 [Candidatus Magnetoglobus multicellularis str. Araruama]